MKPSGFTKISTNYIPYDLPPTVDSTASSRSTLLSYTPPAPEDSNVEIIDTRNAQPLAEGNWRAVLSSDRGYAQPGGEIYLELQLTSPGLRAQSVAIAFRLYQPTCGNIDLSTTKALVRLTNNNGKANLKLNIGRDNSTGCSLRFVAHPVDREKLNSLDLLISSSELEALAVKSQVVTINIPIPATEVKPKSPPVAFGIDSSFSFRDALFSSVDSILQQLETQYTVESAAGTDEAKGGSTDIYKQSGVGNPEVKNPALEASLAFKAMHGSGKVLAERMQAWSKDLLSTVHAGLNDLNSELSIVTSTSGLTNSLSLLRYSTMVTKAGATVATALSTVSEDYAYGNVVKRNSAVRLYNVGQYRLQSSSITSFDTPQLLIASQSTVHQSRYHHLASDLYQQSALQYFLRAEDNLVVMGQHTTRYNNAHLVEKSANASYISGSAIYYGDTLWMQAGQVAGTPLHPNRTSLASTAGYGNAVSLAANTNVVASTSGAAVLKGGSIAVVTGPVTLINSMGFSVPTYNPKVFTPMRDPTPYKKATSTNPLGGLQIGDSQPEPPLTPAGADLGANLYSPLGTTTPPQLGNKTLRRDTTSDRDFD